MTEVTIGRWEEAVCILDNDYDAVGALWLTDERHVTKGGPSYGKRGFFAGTFWWANSEYIASLGYPRRTCRWDAEGWVGETARIVDRRGATMKVKTLPSRDIKICDMYQPVRSLLGHFEERSKRKK